MAPLAKENILVNEAHHYGYKKNFRTALPQLLAVSVKNLLLLGYGMTLGFPTILIPAVKEPVEGENLHLESSEISWISSINLIVVPVGCALSGIVTSPLGRRRAMQMVNVPFFIAWLIFHFSSNTGHLYGALFLTGLAGGLLEAPVLTYVAEITQPHLRGALTATSTLCITIGVFTQFLFGLLFYWRTVALINIIFTILAVIALCFVPESPHWLVSRKKHNEAMKSLQWLRGWTNPQAVEDELKDIQALYKRKEAGNEDQEETLKEKIVLYLDKTFLVPYFLVSFSFFVGHFSGMTTLQTYAVTIFQMLEAPIDKYYATLILGILQILGSITCVMLVHYTGKRPLTFFSTATAGICCLLVAGYEGYMKSSSVLNITTTFDDFNNTTLIDVVDNDLSNPYSWIPTTLLLIVAFVTSAGIRLLPWILIGEVFSAKTRSGAAGLASAIGYIFGFLTNKIYISMLEKLSILGTYTLYGLICLMGCLVFYFILPETEGKALIDIENHFAGVKRLTNEVYKTKKKQTVETSKMRDLKGTSNPTFEGDNAI
ncbi:facilitated trehalose transporter Tret1-like isoform X1 [Vanessa cardui]|uniref:facilitated trehalose transporter Tret1-like isoform X1 n=2 Tax=Vanessa cardui TaxID=171605 RepID=UPI001F136195|nr:facilitated trehalose transporter Tret1-like isoform X1 [Vanessa cardui]XP_046976949.1 facilitated trehalose transporter Tret1-like isoform X1 [Vanessa cardui]XP_046976950.1 facilitated trehalose transporter Tret1-like isoform X1 [Vanessa cardui]